MNKKHFLFVLPICLLFCLSFTTCEEEEVENNLWEKIRNTVWFKYGFINEGSYSFYIGFYGPKNGPYKNDPSLDNLPYIACSYHYYQIDTIGDIIINDDIITYKMTGMQIDRTGKKISFQGGGYIDISVDEEIMTLNGPWEIGSGRYIKYLSAPDSIWNN